MANPNLPETHRALVQETYAKPLTVKTLPTPKPGPGSAVVRILAAAIIPYMRDIYNGKRAYAYPTPLIPGTSAIGRVAGVGPDATTLSSGQLVYVDSLIRGRDDPSAAFLGGVHEGYGKGNRRLMSGEWRNSTYAEYAKVPLENCAVSDEKRLLGKPGEGGLGYRAEELTWLASLLVPFGLLRDIGLKAGETVIVSPATGSLGGAAVVVALAMGARVIAMGRNREALERVKAKSEMIEMVPIMGDAQADAESLKRFGRADAFLDISPPEAARSTHLKSAILSLRHGGRVSLMGGMMEDVGIPHLVVMHWNLMLKGKVRIRPIPLAGMSADLFRSGWYEREDIGALIKMIETGVLKIGEGAGMKIVGSFGLEEWQKAFDVAAGNSGMGLQALIEP